MSLSQRVAVGLIAAIAVAALAWRLPALEARPMHSDEAVNTIKFHGLWRSGSFDYDPTDYHGPTLYYATLPSVWISGKRSFEQTTEFDYRVVTVAFGVAGVLVTLLLLDGLGAVAAVVAAALVAIDPAMLFYSRYYIHEMLMIFFAALALAGGWRWARTGASRWAIVCGASAGLALATKETFAVLAAAAVGALVLTALCSKFIDKGPAWPTTINRKGVAVAAGSLLVAVVLLFSSFLVNPGGLLKLAAAVPHYWERSGGADLHDHPFTHYLQILLNNKLTGKLTLPDWLGGQTHRIHFTHATVFALAGVALLAAFLPKRAAATPSPKEGGEEVAATLLSPNRHLARFLVFYALLLTLMFSAIPYKTPWNVLPFVYAMTLAAGVGFAALVRWTPTAGLKVVVAVVLLLPVAHLAAQSEQLNYRFHSHRLNPYIYAHPVPDVLRLAERVWEVAAVHPQGQHMLIRVVSDEYWPLPWYLRGFDSVGYWQAVPRPTDAPVIIVSPRLQAELEVQLTDNYNVEHRGLRPGVVLAVYIRSDLWARVLEKRGVVERVQKGR